MTLKFLQIANSADQSFRNLFTGGTEHRKMMQPEVGAAIVRIAFLCSDISKFVAKHTSCDWSDDVMLSSSKLKDDMVVEYSDLLNQWKKSVVLEKEARKPLFPRTTLAQTIGYKAVIREQKQLMELIGIYFKIQGSVVASHCKTIAQQAGVLVDALKEMAKVILQSSICPTLSQRETVTLASKGQTSAILNRLQSHLTSNIIMELGNCSLYVMSRDSSYLGFVFLDTPVHTPKLNDSKSVKIAYIETLNGHRRTAIATKLLNWVKATAKDNGYKSLYVKSFLPNGKFWMKFGFTLGKAQATCCLDPMCLDNLINKA